MQRAAQLERERPLSNQAEGVKRKASGRYATAPTTRKQAKHAAG